MTPNLVWLKWIAPVLILVQLALWASGVRDVGGLAVGIIVVDFS